MTGFTQYRFRFEKYHLTFLIAACLLCLLQLLSDRLQAAVNDSGYYFSESILFSSFWWLFFPFLAIEYKLILWMKKKFHLFFIYGTIILTHLICFPLLVWFLSAVWYEHTFLFSHTFSYEITSLLIPIMLIYSLPVCWHLFNQNNFSLAAQQTEKSLEASSVWLKNICVSETNQEVALPVQSIIHISVRAPYICLHTTDKKYLFKSTLKSLSGQLNPAQFIRIHKSAIVNVYEVTCCRSRLNGDYDLTLADGTMLRLSRNYSAQFKQVWKRGHQDNIV